MISHICISYCDCLARLQIQEEYQELVLNYCIEKNEEHGSQVIELKIGIHPTIKKYVIESLLVIGATKTSNRSKTQYGEIEEY